MAPHQAGVGEVLGAASTMPQPPEGLRTLGSQDTGAG